MTGKPEPESKCLRHEPDPETVVRARDDQPADLMNWDDYPVAATCQLCKRRVVSLGLATTTWWDETDETEPHPGIIAIARGAA